MYYPKTTFGYGLNVKAIDEIIEKWPNTKYILTIDNGINTKVATDYAYKKGIKVIVTDHHEPKDGEFPDKAIAVVNPNRIDKPETYPFKGISGAEVVWKIMQLMQTNIVQIKRPTRRRFGIFIRYQYYFRCHACFKMRIAVFYVRLTKNLVTKITLSLKLCNQTCVCHISYCLMAFTIL